MGREGIVMGYKSSGLEKESIRVGGRRNSNTRIFSPIQDWEADGVFVLGIFILPFSKHTQGGEQQNKSAYKFA